jgi:hypothetical protein
MKHISKILIFLCIVVFFVSEKKESKDTSITKKSVENFIPLSVLPSVEAYEVINNIKKPITPTQKTILLCVCIGVLILLFVAIASIFYIRKKEDNYPTVLDH